MLLVIFLYVLNKIIDFAVGWIPYPIECSEQGSCRALSAYKMMSIFVDQQY